MGHQNCRHQIYDFPRPPPPPFETTFALRSDYPRVGKLLLTPPPQKKGIAPKKIFHWKQNLITQSLYYGLSCTIYQTFEKFGGFKTWIFSHFVSSNAKHCVLPKRRLSKRIVPKFKLYSHTSVVKYISINYFS